MLAIRMLIVAALLGMTASTAWAQTDPVPSEETTEPAREDPAERAAELATVAAERYEAGDIEGAIEAFHEAMTHVADPAFAYNLAQLYDYTQVLPQAHRFYMRYLELYPGASNRDEVEARVGELERTLELAYARLVVSSAPAGAELVVTAGGRTDSYGPTPVDGWVSSGTVTMRTQLDGYLPTTRQMNAVAGVRLEVDLGDLAIVPAESPIESAPYVPPPPSRVKRWVGWTLVGVGAAAAATGAVFWGSAKDNEQTHNDLVARIGPDRPELSAADREFLRDEQAQSDATLGNVLFGVGVAALVGGTLLLVLDSLEDEPTPRSTAGPMLFDQGLGMGWTGRF